MPSVLDSALFISVGFVFATGAIPIEILIGQAAKEHFGAVGEGKVRTWWRTGLDPKFSYAAWLLVWD